jgi:hypothetical protein
VRYLISIIIFFSTLFGSQIKIYRDGIILFKGKDGKQYVRVYLNHENSSQNQITLSGLNPAFSIDLPIANRWQVLGARAVIKYTPSIALEETRSFLNIRLRNYTLRQYQLIQQQFLDSGELKIEMDLPYKDLDKHNLFTLQLFQHYVKKGAEDMNKAPEVWTQINLEDSYIELEIKPKKIENELSSLIGSIFDIYNPVEQKINYVFTNKRVETIYNYTFFSSILGKILQYRKVDFTITHKKIKYDRDNLIIATTSELRTIFEINDFGFQIKGNINIFRNPKDPSLAIIIITAKTHKRLKEVLYSTFGLDLNLNSGNNKIIKKVISPPPAKAYTAPEFIRTGRKIFFYELGYKTRSFQGFSPPSLNIRFKLYPDLHFIRHTNGHIDINYIFPFSVQKESIANVFVNNVFVSQAQMLEERETQTLKKYLKLDPEIDCKYPVDLLQGGYNTIRIDLSMIPLNWNPNTLQASILENSYFEIPEGAHWIKMAALKYFTSSAFPFSIYPDLQDTFFLLTDDKDVTIEALMEVARFLGESIKYPPYYMEVGTTLTEENKNKNIIMIGNYNDKFSSIYRSAPLILAKQGYVRNIDLFNKFAETLDELKERKVRETEEERKEFIRIFATTQSSLYLITQFFQSPFNSNKTILMFSGKNINIKDEVKQILDPKFREKIRGDLVISKLTSSTDRELFNFHVKDDYFIGEFSTLERIYFMIGENPYLFVIVSVFFIILTTYLLRKVLLIYKVRYHADADSRE